MKSRESISLSISNIIFHMNASDYEMLSAYLKVVKNYYHSLPNGQKVFEEFQFDLSEFLLEKLKNDGQYVVADHIDEVKAKYGAFDDVPHEKIDNAERMQRNMNISPVKSALRDQDNLQNVMMTALSILGLSF